MTVLRIFVSYEAKDVAFATQLMTDLREAGAEVITDSAGLQDAAFEQFLSEELPQCQQLIVVQTPEALQSPRVGAIVDTALQYVQQGQMTGVLRMLAPTLDAVEEQAVPLMWATTPEFDASLDYPRALAKLLWNLGLIEIDDIPNSPPSPASYIPPIVALDLKGSGDKSSVSDTFHAQIPGSLDRPVGPPRKSHVLLRSPFILFSLVIVLVLAVASVAVFIDQSLTHRQSTLAATNTLIPTPTTIHTPTPHPTPTPTPIPTPTPTQIPTPTPIPTPTQAPILAPTSPPTPTATPTQVVPTCTGSVCDGKDPRTAHGPHGIACWNDHAFVVASQLVKYGVVYLWYSSGCSTNWAETLQTGGTTYIANANITRSSDNRHYDSTWYASDVWTVMVYAPSTTTNACGSINNATGGCSGFH